MPRGYIKIRRPTSYYSAKGMHRLQKALLALEQVPDLKDSQTLADMKAFLPVVSEMHTLILMREQGMDISGFTKPEFTKQTKLETPDLEIIEEAET